MCKVEGMKRYAKEVYPPEIFAEFLTRLNAENRTQFAKTSGCNRETIQRTIADKGEKLSIPLFLSLAEHLGMNPGPPKVTVRSTKTNQAAVLDGDGDSPFTRVTLEQAISYAPGLGNSQKLLLKMIADRDYLKAMQTLARLIETEASNKTLKIPEDI